MQRNHPHTGWPIPLSQAIFSNIPHRSTPSDTRFLDIPILKTEGWSPLPETAGFGFFDLPQRPCMPLFERVEIRYNAPLYEASDRQKS